MSQVPPPNDEYPAMIQAIRNFLDDVAAAKPPPELTAALTKDLQRWSQALADVAVSEAEQVFGRRPDAPNFGESVTPPFDPGHSDPQSVTGTVIFGRYYLGGNGAAHGGTITLLFDDVLGRLAISAGRSKSRTAYLKIDFRAIAPIEVKLDVRAWFVSEEGRKRLIRGEIRHGETVCAEAEGLFIELKPGQA